MTHEGPSSLSYPVRAPVVLKYLGQLGLMLAVLTSVPFGVSLLFGEYGISGRYLAIIALLILLGFPLSRLVVPPSLYIHEAMVVTTLAFLLSPLLMSFPLMGAGLSFEDAVFEAISGITTTGLTTLTNLENKSGTFLFARAWMQWYGGLGIAVLTVGLLLEHGIATKQLVEPLPEENLVTTTRAHARRVLAGYLGLTLVGIGMLWFVQLDPFQAVILTLTAVSTGGFAPFDASLAGLNSLPISSLVLLFSFLGAVSLPLYYAVYHQGLRRLRSNVEWPMLIVLCVMGGGIMGVALARHTDLSWMNAVAHGMLLSVSAQTGTGFSTWSVPELDATSKALLILPMVIGGSVGSTSGGIKLLRLLIVVYMVRFMIQRVCAPPHAVIEPWLGEKRLEQEDVNRALLLIILFVGIIFLSWLCFLVDGYDPMDSLFEVVSAVGTVGLSAGITSHDLPSWLKGILCFDMLAGRVEIIALLVTLYPKTWVGRKGQVP